MKQYIFAPFPPVLEASIGSAFDTRLEKLIPSNAIGNTKKDRFFFMIFETLLTEDIYFSFSVQFF
tara:strand:- start:1886 stop:2080 length:195 start_codon:yes stop_codon:yes gene_type:complete